MIHLHLHTHFSFGIGVSAPDVLATAAAERFQLPPKLIPLALRLPPLRPVDEGGVHRGAAAERSSPLALENIPSTGVRSGLYGENRPLEQGSGEDVWATNRRVEFVVLPPSGGGAVRHMVYHAPSNSMWFGTDTGTIGRARLPQ